jgi:hypothetical protein
LARVRFADFPELWFRALLSEDSAEWVGLTVTPRR